MTTPVDGFIYTTGSADAFSIAPPIVPRIVIPGEDGQPLVTIHPNGTLEYGPNYDPDEAARRFWEAMRYCMPARCEHCGHVPGQQVS